MNMESAEGLTPLHICVIKKRLLTLHLLVDREDVDINARDNTGKTPLRYAVSPDKEQPEEQGMHFVQQEAPEGTQIEIVKALLSHKLTRINLKDNDGKTPLDIVSELAIPEKDEIISLLLEKKSPI